MKNLDAEARRCPTLPHFLAKPHPLAVSGIEPLRGKKGSNRVDTFWGAGSDARRIAGGMSAKGQALILLPKGVAARAIARGIMSRPKLLMIDELSLGLAPKIVDQLSATLRQIMHEGLSLLLVEQDVATAFELTTRGVVVDSGRVRISGPTDELAVNPMVQQAYMGIA